MLITSYLETTLTLYYLCDLPGDPVELFADDAKSSHGREDYRS